MNKYLSASRLINWLFPDKFKDIPKYIIQQAAEFGQEFHQLVESYLKNYATKDEIIEMATNEKIKNCLYMFLNFINKKEYEIGHIEVEKEYFNKKRKIHGFIDFYLQNEKEIILIDWKTRSNLNQKDGFLTEKIQMIFYEMLFSTKKNINWKIIIFNKNKRQYKILEKNNIDKTEYKELKKFIIKAINLYKKTEKLKGE